MMFKLVDVTQGVPHCTVDIRQGDVTHRVYSGIADRLQGVTHGAQTS